MEVPQETLNQMTAIKSALDELEEHMQPFLEAAPKDISSQLTPLERVKVHLALAQAVVVLYQLHRRLDAAKLDSHPIQKELERLSAYERKVKKAITADDLARSRPGTSLNIAAANRFIDAAIPDLTPAQKQQLRQLGKVAAAGDKGDGRDSSSKPNTHGSGGSKRSQQGQQQHQQQKVQDGSDSEGGVGDEGLPEQGGTGQQQQQRKKRKQQQHGAASAAAADEAQEFLQSVMADLGGTEG